MSRSHFFKFTQQRLDKQRLVFDAVFAGILLLILSFGVSFAMELLFPKALVWLYHCFPLQTSFIGTAFGALFLSVLLTEVSNRTLFKNRKRQIMKAIEGVGNELELLLRSSVIDSKLLQFTLDSHKVYVGWVEELPVPSVTNYIRIIPVFSGFRNAQQNVVFDTHYLSVYGKYIKEGKIKHIKELEPDLVIALNSVVTVSFFDIEMYERFNSE